MGVESLCDQSVALFPRAAGASFLTLPAGPEGASVNTGGQAVRSVVFSADGTKAYVGANGLVREVDVATGTTLRTAALLSTPSDLVVSPDGTTLYAAGGEVGTGVMFVDLATFTVTANVMLNNGQRDQTPKLAALSPDGRSLYVAADYSGTSFGLYMIDTATRQVVRRGTTGPVPKSIAVTADGSKVLSTRTSFSAKLDVYDSTTLASLASVNVDQPASGVDELGSIAVGSDSSVAYVADRTAQDIVVVDVNAGTVLRRLSGFQSVSAVGINWAGTRLVIAGEDGSLTQVAWDVADPSTGAVRASGMTTDAAAGTYNGLYAFALCPRFVATPAPSPSGGSTATPADAPAACPVPLATALDKPRISRSGGRPVVSQALRLDQSGRYTFIYEVSGGQRVPLLRGSRVSQRVLGRTFTAPVRTAQGPAERVTITARLAWANASGVHLRVVRRAADGTLCGTSLK